MPVIDHLGKMPPTELHLNGPQDFAEEGLCLGPRDIQSDYKEPEASSKTSGENATDRTQLECLKTCFKVPVVVIPVIQNMHFPFGDLVHSVIW